MQPITRLNTVVLVVREIFGVNEHIRDVCRRFAKLGYLAVAPELFIRQGDVSRMADTHGEDAERAAEGRRRLTHHRVPGRRARLFADYRQSYREAEAKDAWSRMLEWFRKHCVA